MKCKSGFVTIFTGYYHLAIADTDVRSGENRSIIKRVDALVHACYNMGVYNAYCVQLAEFRAESECSLFFGANRTKATHSTCQANNLHYHYFVDLVFLKFLCMCTGPVWCWIDWTLASWSELDSVFSCFNLFKCTSGMFLRSIAILQTFGPMHIVIVRYFYFCFSVVLFDFLNFSCFLLFVFWVPKTHY